MPSLVNGLKAIMATEEATRAEVDMVIESVSSGNAIRDSFLDDPDIDLEDVDTDPEIGQLLEQIPEFTASDRQVEEKINRALESLV